MERIRRRVETDSISRERYKAQGTKQNNSRWYWFCYGCKQASKEYFPNKLVGQRSALIHRRGCSGPLKLMMGWYFSHGASRCECGNCENQRLMRLPKVETNEQSIHESH